MYVSSKLPLLSVRPSVTSATLKRAATNFAAWWTGASMGVNSLPKTVTQQHRNCDLNPGPSAPESSTLTTRLPSHPILLYRILITTDCTDVAVLQWQMLAAECYADCTRPARVVSQGTDADSDHQQGSRHQVRPPFFTFTFFIPPAIVVGHWMMPWSIHLSVCPVQRLGQATIAVQTADFTEARQWVAVASAGTYASLQLTPDR